MKIKIGIVGAAGYTGGELVRLLLHHPNASLQALVSRSQAGKNIAAVHPDLLGETDLVFTDQLAPSLDLVFLCVGHGEARQWLTQNPLDPNIKIIDLSQDFRLLANAQWGTQPFVYGLPELNRLAIQSATQIANPGCFATALQLALLPLAQAGILGEVYATGITGSTGAGQSLSASSHFSWRNNNIEAYKTLTHQHLHEITQSVNQLQGEAAWGVNGTGAGLRFVPWRGDFARGIYASLQLESGLPLSAIKGLFQEFYADHPFTHLSDTMIHLKQVVNTNKCLLHIEKQGDTVVVHSAIDNLLKGASGQAVQNMNLVFGLPETTGLQLKANYF